MRRLDVLYAQRRVRPSEHTTLPCIYCMYRGLPNAVHTAPHMHMRGVPRARHGCTNACAMCHALPRTPTLLETVTTPIQRPTAYGTLARINNNSYSCPTMHVPARGDALDGVWVGGGVEIEVALGQAERRRAQLEAAAWAGCVGLTPGYIHTLGCRCATSSSARRRRPPSKSRVGSESITLTLSVRPVPG